jgi:hypothetical protein
MYEPEDDYDLVDVADVQCSVAATLTEKW